MGEKARRKAAAAAAGMPLPPPRRCPSAACRSREVVDVRQGGAMARQAARAWGKNPATFSTPLQRCLACGVVWEAPPPDVSLPPEEREPCDTCPYRTDGDLRDPVRRDALLRLAAQAAAEGLRPGGWFLCHKNVPMRPGRLGGMEFAHHLVDGDPASRACAGFLRTVVACMRLPDDDQG